MTLTCWTIPIRIRMNEEERILRFKEKWGDEIMNEKNEKERKNRTNNERKY